MKLLTIMTTTQMTQYEEEIKSIESKCRILLRDINDEDSMRDSFLVRKKQRNLEKELNMCIKRKNELLSKVQLTKECYDILKNKIAMMITNDLTIGRTDNDLAPYSDDQITDFIKANGDKIDSVIHNMIIDYDNDNELTLLKDPQLDWIREYLYPVVTTMSFLDN